MAPNDRAVSGANRGRLFVSVLSLILSPFGSKLLLVEALLFVCVLGAVNVWNALIGARPQIAAVSLGLGR